MKTIYSKVGLFVICGLLLSGAAMFLIGDRHQAFTRHIEYYSDFVNLAGLTKGAQVRVAGMVAGEVVSIGVPKSPSSGFRVKWRIDAKMRGLVRTDSVATIATEGVVGDTYMAVRTGSAKAPQPPRSRLFRPGSQPRLRIFWPEAMGCSTTPTEC